VKAAGLERGTFYYAAKINANFPANPASFGLPTIQGVIALFDTANGRLLALMDSIEITSVRTASATALAAMFLTNRDADSIAIVGCGNQGRAHLRALSRVRTIDHVSAYDSNPQAAEHFATAMTDELNVSVKAFANIRQATRGSAIIVTCTPSCEPLLFPDDVSAGAFIAGVGADNEHKNEIAPELLASNTVVADVVDQCAVIGDLHHAIEAGAMLREDVHAELADIVSGRRPGRSSRDEIIIFDSTGTALEDVAAASVVYEGALSRDIGIRVNLGS
jgi:ornithine cyclodeaminase/alanine dehydrogenase-like protein (mu-crystallin family)